MLLRIGLRLLFASALVLVAAPVGSAGTLPVSFQETTVFSGLTNPTALRFASDGRVFVAEKSGLVKVFPSLSSSTPTTVADLRTEVDDYWDRGLLGLALDPSFPTKPYVYVLYTFDAAIGGVAPRWNDVCPTPPGPTTDGCVVSGRLSRLTISGNTATSEQVLIEDWCQQFPSHSLGDLRFGPDGALYVSAGDGASFDFADYGQKGSPLNPCGDPPAGVGGTETPPTAEGGALRSQSVRRPANEPVTLDGGILRVDPTTGAAPFDNPLSGSTNANARRIVAYGVRNPFRFTIRPGTNELWVGDVGWNTWEEIERIQSPTDANVENFGWPCYEGTPAQGAYQSANLNLCSSLYSAGTATAPYYAYNHSAKIVAGETCPTGSSSVTGVAFYTSGSYPTAYNGTLFFADHSRNCIWAMQAGANGLPDPTKLVTFDAGASNPVALESGPNGDLFYVDHEGGTIRRIQYLGGNRAPVVVSSATPTSGTAPLAVSFDGSGSSDPDPGDTIAYAWDLDGNGLYNDSIAPSPTYTYTAAGTYTARLRVTDSHGASTLGNPLTITVSNPPPVATISTPAPGTTWKVADSISFSGSAVDGRGNPLPASALTWSLIIHHCPSNCHTHLVQTWAGVASGSFSAPDHEYPSYLELQLVATDGGQTDTKSVQLDPQTVNLSFSSSPSGLQLAVGSTTQATPFTRTVIIGSANSLSAPTPQTLGANTYAFGSWSDGGAQTHTIVAPATAAAFSATYAVTAGPVAAYGFDAGSGTTVADVSGNGNTGTTSNTSWSTTGRYGGALSFNGSNSLVTVNDAASLDLTTQMTLEAWVNASKLGTTTRTVLFKQQTSALVYALFANTGTKVPAGAVNPGAEIRVNGTAALALNTWTHLAATWDGATLRLYVNGALAASLAASGTLPNSTGPLRIGGNSVSGQYFKGLIDEVRVYRRALPQAEIQNDMQTPVASAPTADTTAPSVSLTGPAAGAALRATIAVSATASDNVGVAGVQFRLDGAPLGAEDTASPYSTSWDTTTAANGSHTLTATARDAAGNTTTSAPVSVTVDNAAPSVSVTAPVAGSTVSGTTTVTAAASDNVAVSGVQFRVDGAALGAEDTASPYSVPWDTTTAANGSHTLTAVARDAAGNTTTAAAVTVTVSNAAPPPPPSGLVAAYGFNEGTGTSTADASGTGNTGTVANTTWIVSGKFGGALSFDGADSWVTVNDAASLDLTTGMTLEAWVNPAALATIWRCVIIKQQTSGLVYTLYANTDQLVPATQVAPAGEINLYGTATLPLNTWTHLAGTYDGTTLKLYVNGALAASTPASGALPNSTGPLRIGGNSIWPEWFSGLIDEVRVFNRARTQAEIQTDMQTAVG